MVNRPLLSPETDLDLESAQWIVFSNETDIRVLKILKQGFRHCFMVMQQGEKWMLIDPRSNKTDIQILPHPSHFNFPRYFTEQGHTVLKVPEMNAPQKIMTPFPVSCVEGIKRIIGLHKFWVITPHQLYKKIIKIQKKGL
jgi:hypothetical protein